MFRIANGSVAATAPVAICPLAELAADPGSGGSSIVLTDKPDSLLRLLGSAFIVKDVHASCRGDVVAFLGYQKARKREFADIPSLEPMYLKDFVVRTASAVS